MKTLVLSILLSLVSLNISATTTIDTEMQDWAKVQLRTQSNGFVKNTSRDSYFVIQDLEIPRASIRSIQLKFELEENITRPMLMELFWRSQTLGFSEHEKAMFVVTPNKDSRFYDITLPLFKLYNFSGNLSFGVYQEPITQLRIDYPMLHTVSIKFDQVTLLSTDAVPENSRPVELYEAISADNFINGDVIVPKLVDIFQTGLKKFRQDWLFTIFWLGCLIVTLMMIRRCSSD